MESQVADRSFWQLIRSTPMRDVVRLRLTGRLDWKRRVAACGLDQSLRDHITQIIQRTRLWKLEKTELADELIAHFQDAADNEVSAVDSVARFGDPKTAAKLIRRAKIRGRSVIWHAFKWFRRGVALLTIIYLALAAIFYSGHPTPKTDYMAILNGEVNSAPADQIGWPIYRAVWLKFDLSSPQRLKVLDQMREWNDPISPEVEAWIAANQQEIAMLRDAASKPQLGFVYGRKGSVNDAELFPDLVKNYVPPDDEMSRLMSDAMVSTLIPHLNHLRESARILRFDAAVAANQKDSARFISDVHALQGMARQLQFQKDFLIVHLIAVSLWKDSNEQFAMALARHPELFSDVQLKSMAHEIAGPSVARDIVSFEGETMIIRDVIQRLYTDDGTGDGRMTPQGLQVLQMVMSWDGIGDYRQQIATISGGPATVLGMASRKQVLARYAGIVAAYDANLRRPMRDAQPVTDSLVSGQEESLGERLRYLPLACLTPSITGVSKRVERVLGERDGLLVAIACELYRRSNGKYPDRIEDLSPRLLPSVPADRITGNPLKLRYAEGKPLIYSVGVDRDDDAGKRPRVSIRKGIDVADWNLPANALPNDGDWVLFPPAIAKE